MGFRIANGFDGVPEIGFKDTTTAVVARGDLLKVSTGKVIRMASAADNLAFEGIALEDSPAGANRGFKYAPPRGAWLNAEFEVDLDTATACVKGDKLAWNAAQKLIKGTTDAICVCSHANSGSSAKTVRFRMLSVQAGGLGDAS